MKNDKSYRSPLCIRVQYISMNQAWPWLSSSRSSRGPANRPHADTSQVHAPKYLHKPFATQRRNTLAGPTRNLNGNKREGCRYNEPIEPFRPRMRGRMRSNEVECLSESRPHPRGDTPGSAAPCPANRRPGSRGPRQRTSPRQGARPELAGSSVWGLT